MIDLTLTSSADLFEDLYAKLSPAVSSILFDRL